MPWPVQVSKTGFHCAPPYPPALHSVCPSSTMVPEPWAEGEMFPEPWAVGEKFTEPWAGDETSYLGLNTQETLIPCTSTTYESQH